MITFPNFGPRAAMPTVRPYWLERGTNEQWTGTHCSHLARKILRPAPLRSLMKKKVACCLSHRCRCVCPRVEMKTLLLDSPQMAERFGPVRPTIIEFGTRAIKFVYGFFPKPCRSEQTIVIMVERTRGEKLGRILSTSSDPAKSMASVHAVRRARQKPALPLPPSLSDAQLPRPYREKKKHREKSRPR